MLQTLLPFVGKCGRIIGLPPNYTKLLPWDYLVFTVRLRRSDHDCEEQLRCCSASPRAPPLLPQPAAPITRAAPGYETRAKPSENRRHPRYSADPTRRRCAAPMRSMTSRCSCGLPGDPVPPEFIEAAHNPAWIVAAHNDHFETAIEQHILGPAFGWPLIPLERHRCTMAMALAADCRHG